MGSANPWPIPTSWNMVEQVKPLASTVELITNGMLLTEQVARQLIKLDLDVLWISVDGTNAENMADVRIGADLQQIFENIERVNILRHETARKPEIGISFVAMRRNIADLPALLRMGPGWAFRASWSPTSCLTPKRCARRCSTRARVDGVDSVPSPSRRSIDLPRIDLDDTSKEAIVRACATGTMSP